MKYSKYQEQWDARGLGNHETIEFSGSFEGQVLINILEPEPAATHNTEYSELFNFK